MDKELKILLYVVIGLVIGAILGGAINYGSSWRMMDGMMMGGGTWIWLILVPLLIIVIFLAFSREEKESDRDKALEILREKYAEGEITEEEFEEKKKKLQ